MINVSLHLFNLANRVKNKIREFRIKRKILENHVRITEKTGNEGTNVDGIGNIIFKEREKAGISQEKLSEGICSATTLSRLEWNEQNISKWHIDAFMQRLGRSQDNFWTIVHIGDYTLMEQRRKIWSHIISGDYKAAEKIMKEYESAGNIENLHEQFLVKCRGMIKARKEHDWQNALELFLKSITITVPKFAADRVEELVIGREEMEIIMLMAEAYISLEEEEKARILLKGLLKNIQKKEWDEEELVKIYPKVVKNFVPFLKKKDKYEEVISICKKAVELLVDNGIIFLLAELMECVCWGLERRIEVEERRFSIQEEQEHEQFKKHIGVLDDLWEEYGNFPKEDMVYYTNVQKDISVSNEIIAKCRKLCNLSQEKLSEDICTVEQLSRIERGKCSPMEKSYRALMEKMNQAQERNRFFINAQEYHLHEKMRQVERHIAEAEYKKTFDEWVELRKELPADSLNNQQYIARYDTLLKYYNKQICIQKAITEYKQALKITMPDYEIVDITKWPLSRNEIVLLNNIANSYCMLGNIEQAKQIYYPLWETVLKSSTDTIYHITEYRMMTYNIGIIEGMAQNYGRAKEMLLLGIKYCMMAGRIEVLPRFLFAMGWTLKSEGKEENDEKARNILEQAFYLGNMLNLSSICNEIYTYCKEECHFRIRY